MNDLDKFKMLDLEIHREHGLIATRMGWYFTAQAFLLGAFASAGAPDSKVSWLRWLLPLIGVASSSIVHVGIQAGLDAMEALRERIRAYQNDELKTLFGRFLEPELHERGMLAAKTIPPLFIAVWLLVLVLGLMSL